MTPPGGEGWGLLPTGEEDVLWAEKGEFDRQQEWRMTARQWGVSLTAGKGAGWRMKRSKKDYVWCEKTPRWCIDKTTWRGDASTKIWRLPNPAHYSKKISSSKFWPQERLLYSFFMCNSTRHQYRQHRNSAYTATALVNNVNTRTSAHKAHKINFKFFIVQV